MSLPVTHRTTTIPWQRLEQARRLLDLPGARLAEVAQRTGFADQAHFTRLFKRAYGLPPGALLRRRGH